MDNKSSGSLGVVGIIGVIILFYLLRRFFPSLTNILLIAGGVIGTLILILVVAVIFLAFWKPKEKAKGPDGEVKDIISKGRTSLMELRNRGTRIKNSEIRKLNEENCKIAEKILNTLKEQPEDISKARQFLNYYLPTLSSILLKYVRLEESGVPAEQITESVISCLGDIKTALDKQYANLFDNDILDLSVEMEVLTQICKRDGLLEDENFRL